MSAFKSLAELVAEAANPQQAAMNHIKRIEAEVSAIHKCAKSLGTPAIACSFAVEAFANGILLEVSAGHENNSKFLSLLLSTKPENEVLYFSGIKNDIANHILKSFKETLSLDDYTKLIEALQKSEDPAEPTTGTLYNTPGFTAE